MKAGRQRAKEDGEKKALHPPPAGGRDRADDPIEKGELRLFGQGAAKQHRQGHSLLEEQHMLAFCG